MTGGTTTATLLAHAIYAEGVRNVAAGASAIALKRGMDRALTAAVAAIRAQARPVASKKEKVQIAAISAHNDLSIGQVAADAIEQVGAEGVIAVEEARGTETALEVVQGMQFDRGYLSPYFVTDPEKMEAVVEDPLILLYERKISTLQDFLPLLEQVVSDKDTTTIIGGAGTKEAVAARCAELRRQIETTTSSYDKEKLQERVGRLSGGVAVIRVGAPSEAELKSRKEAYEDAISATKAAMAEGVVPGAGLALLRAIPAVDAEAAKCEGDEATGALILKQAFEMPTRQLAENSAVDGGVVVDRMRNGTGNQGFDAARGQYVDLVEAGIIDPAKVVRVALENAVSVASVLLLTEATLTKIPEAKPEPAPGSAAAFD